MWLLLLRPETSNDSLRAALAGSSSGPVDESIYKLDLINESLAFTIENAQGSSHAMKLLHRQMKDTADMDNPEHKTFYRRRQNVG
uniref:Uncharacterized protein n=1 Tax=Hyaloperonospora arabidopsidis (strain Emoy2) TaxID=559515 RepID=M4B3R6_HYAAE